MGLLVLGGTFFKGRRVAGSSSYLKNCRAAAEAPGIG